VRKFSGRLLFLIVVVVWASQVSSPTGLNAPAQSPKFALTADEALSLSLINSERADHGLRPLALDPLLTEVARRHSADMAERHYFSHLTPPPTSLDPLDRYAQALGRRPEGVVGENIARTDLPLMGKIHEGLLASPTHRANLLDMEYTRAGVGIYALDDGRVWLTQLFCGDVPRAR